MQQQSALAFNENNPAVQNGHDSTQSTVNVVNGKNIEDESFTGNFHINENCNDNRANPGCKINMHDGNNGVNNPP
jgi:hypothetical protein